MGRPDALLADRGHLDQRGQRARAGRAAQLRRRRNVVSPEVEQRLIRQVFGLVGLQPPLADTDIEKTNINGDHRLRPACCWSAAHAV